MVLRQRELQLSVREWQPIEIVQDVVCPSANDKHSVVYDSGCLLMSHQSLDPLQGLLEVAHLGMHSQQVRQCSSLVVDAGAR